MIAPLLADADILSRSDPRAGEAHLRVGVDGETERDGAVLRLGKGRGATGYPSVTAAVQALDGDTFAAWHAACGAGADAASPFANLGIAVEDAAPDTALALIALALRLTGKALDPIWAGYADRWETGDTATTGTPYASFGALASALAHAEYDGWDGVPKDLSARFATAVPDVVALGRALIETGHDPAALPDAPDLPAEAMALHRRARARLRYEETIYRHHVAGGQTLQLAIPLAGTGRKRLVDAVLFSETVPSSVLKIFSRTDPESFGGAGYAFQGLHRARPGLKGSGADVTFSTDPEAGLSLRGLWLELERREEAAWDAFAATEDGFARPRDPEKNRVLTSYDILGVAAPAPCLEPWYDGGEEATILAAPYTVAAPDGERTPGSRLDWTEAKDALWRCYAPTFGLRLRRRGQEMEARRFTDAQSGPALREPLNLGAGVSIGDLERAIDAGEGAVLWTSTLRAAFAEFVERGDTGIDTMPAQADFDFLDERGGIVAVTAHGIGLIDSSLSGAFPADDLRSAASDAALTLKVADDLEAAVTRIRDLVQKAIETGKDTDKREALKAIYAARRNARNIVDEARNHEQDGFVRRVRSLCDARWLASSRYESALQELTELETQLTAFSDVRAGMVLDKLAIYGLPLSIAGNLLGGIVLLDKANDFAGLAIPIVIACLGLLIGGIAMTRLILLRARRAWSLNGWKL